MKNILYLLILTTFFAVIIYDHKYSGVAYNPLFHKEGETSGSINAMPCGLGGAQIQSMFGVHLGLVLHSLRHGCGACAPSNRPHHTFGVAWVV